MPQNFNSEIIKMRDMVAKFGGTSLADRKSWKHVKSIIRDEDSRRYVVVSAPGRRYKGDPKVTDLLIQLARTKEPGTIDSIVNRYSEIFPRQTTNAAALREDLQQGISMSEHPLYIDYMASRGEHWMARMGATNLGADFVDGGEIFRMEGESSHGRVNEAVSYNLVRAALKCLKRKVIIPGFFGKNAEGDILTFDRGGSDLTGAHVAAALGVGVYENFTDSPILAADPNIVNNPHKIKAITYDEIRSLAYSGFKVLHEHAMIPISESRIPIHVRSTEKYPEEGTWVVYERLSGRDEKPIIGVAFRDGFCSFTLAGFGIDDRTGAQARAGQVLADYGISNRFSTTGINDFGFIFEEEQINDRHPTFVTELVSNLEKAVGGDVKVTLEEDFGAMVVAGKQLRGGIGVSSGVEKTLADNGISIAFKSQSSTEGSMVWGVRHRDASRAVNAVYEEHVKRLE